MFKSATLKLTAWYLLIIMTISIAFSVVIYGVSSAELNRPFPVRALLNSHQRVIINSDDFEEVRQVFVSEGRERLLVNLVVANIATLALGGGASYLLARRTLRPIQEAMDAQGRFTSDASHELRTPLTALQTEIEVALRDRKLNKN
jgi:signal transduction histidine kinase